MAAQDPQADDLVDNVRAVGNQFIEMHNIRNAMRLRDFEPEQPFTAEALARLFGDNAPPQGGYTPEKIQAGLTRFLEQFVYELRGETKKLSDSNPESIAMVSRSMHREIKTEAEIAAIRRQEIDEMMADIPAGTESDPDIAETIVAELEARGLSPGAPAEPQSMDEMIEAIAGDVEDGVIEQVGQEPQADAHVAGPGAPSPSETGPERIDPALANAQAQAERFEAGQAHQDTEALARDDVIAEIAADVEDGVVEPPESPESPAPAEPEAEQEQPHPEPEATPESTTHIVQPGDTLSQIVRDHYGADAKVDYMAVAEYNRQNNPELSRDLVANPHDIREGDQIRLPPQSELEGVDAPAAPAQADPRLAEVQSYLYAKGYEEVKIDGLDDGATRAALLGEGIEPDQDMEIIHAKVAELAGHGNDDINGYLNKNFHLTEPAPGSDEAKAAQGLLNLRNDGDLKLDGKLGPKSRELEGADRQARGEAVAALDAEKQQAEIRQAADRMAEGVGIEQVPQAGQEKGTWDKIREALGADQPRAREDRGAEYDVHIDRNANGWPSIRLERIDPGAIKVGGDPVITKPYNEAASQTAGTLAPQLEQQAPQAESAIPQAETAAPQERQWQAPKI